VRKILVEVIAGSLRSPCSHVPATVATTPATEVFPNPAASARGNYFRA